MEGNEMWYAHCLYEGCNLYFEAFTMEHAGFLVQMHEIQNQGHNDFEINQDPPPDDARVIFIF